MQTTGKVASFIVFAGILMLLIYKAEEKRERDYTTDARFRNLEISLAVKTKENEALKEELKKLMATCSVYSPAPILHKPVEVVR